MKQNIDLTLNRDFSKEKNLKKLSILKNKYKILYYENDISLESELIYTGDKKQEV